jgi:hypothetical protein
LLKREVKWGISRIEIIKLYSPFWSKQILQIANFPVGTREKLKPFLLNLTILEARRPSSGETFQFSANTHRYRNDWTHNFLTE